MKYASNIRYIRYALAGASIAGGLAMIVGNPYPAVLHLVIAALLAASPSKGVR